jgi:hypothetical protein
MDPNGEVMNPDKFAYFTGKLTRAEIDKLRAQDVERRVDLQVDKKGRITHRTPVIKLPQLPPDADFDALVTALAEDNSSMDWAQINDEDQLYVDTNDYYVNDEEALAADTVSIYKPKSGPLKRDMVATNPSDLIQIVQEKPQVVINRFEGVDANFPSYKDFYPKVLLKRDDDSLIYQGQMINSRIWCCNHMHGEIAKVEFRFADNTTQVLPLDHPVFVRYADQDWGYLTTIFSNARGLSKQDFKLPAVGKAALFDVVNKSFSAGAITDALGSYDVSTDVGACGAAVLQNTAEHTYVVGFHFADHRFVPVTDDLVDQFFRHPDGRATANKGAITVRAKTISSSRSTTARNPSVPTRGSTSATN